ncbi:hypothetical protein FNU76_18780 [Chitinimonas arctica]|uniref:Uncharacterized protein n=1 Tax=Chitinimonas arctica TaxID=2594795 RepID=A0A516SJB0_9NEIS|nr:hypothetical protein [Chitinimonas arctica]QDQ28227.1 hypothetical protein FNU76_18780 [Chitinimonas arctica]
MAIFKSVPQALHFAYTIEAYEIGAESAMTKALRRIMMDLGIWEEPGTTNTSVDFSGLDRIEVRAQCAMIRQMVDDHLPWEERCAIVARYEPAERVEENGKRRFLFSPIRYEAIRALSEYLAPSFGRYNRDTIDLIVARVSDRRVVEGGYREVAAKLGMAHTTFADVYKRVRGRVIELENQAADRLLVRFSPELVESDTCLTN